MSEDVPAWRAPGQALTAELRALAEALAVKHLDPEALSEAAALVRRARALVDGPPRSRWYDDAQGLAGEEFTRVARLAYQEQSPIRGLLNPVAPPLTTTFEEREDGTPVVRGTATLSASYEGPPHGVHGGWVAALFDEVLGNAQHLAGVRGVTASLTVKYRHVTPLDEPLRFEAWIHERSGKRIVAHATCHAGDTLTAEADALFIAVDFDAIRARMQERRSG